MRQGGIDDRLHLGFENLGRHRHEQVVERTEPEAGFAVLVRDAVRTEKHNGRGERTGALADQACRFEAIDPPHFHVQKNQ